MIKDWCTGFPEKWIGIDISPCCKEHDETLGTHTFYRCLKNKIGWFHAGYITLGGAIVANGELVLNWKWQKEGEIMVGSYLMLSSHPDYKPKDKCSCGSDKAKFDYVPDTIYGISIKQSCCRHDDRFERGGTIKDFEQANREFLSNMLIEIEEGAKWYTPTFLARRRAMNYYEAVCRFGESSFNFKDEHEDGYNGT